VCACYAPGGRQEFPASGAKHRDQQWGQQAIKRVRGNFLSKRGRCMVTAATFHRARGK
jgi:hypothetical protein